MVFKDVGDMIAELKDTDTELREVGEACEVLLVRILAVETKVLGKLTRPGNQDDII